MLGKVKIQRVFTSVSPPNNFEKSAPMKEQQRGGIEATEVKISATASQQVSKWQDSGRPAPQGFQLTVYILQ